MAPFRTCGSRTGSRNRTTSPHDQTSTTPKNGVRKAKLNTSYWKQYNASRRGRSKGPPILGLHRTSTIAGPAAQLRMLAAEASARGMVFLWRAARSTRPSGEAERTILGVFERRERSEDVSAASSAERRHAPLRVQRQP